MSSETDLFMDEWKVFAMKMIYSCDLHGDTRKYEALKKLISSGAYDVLVIGGDLLEYTSRDVDMQIGFVQEYLANFFKSLHIPSYLIKGNTDTSAAFNLLKSLAPSNVKFLSEIPVKINGMHIFGFDLINPSPFKIKNDERRDLAGENYIFSPTLIRTDRGELELKPSDYLNDLPSIEEELLKYKGVTGSIFVCHVPPFGTKLDVAGIGNHVGSKAVYEFILRTQPLLVLCGHIHESPGISNSCFDYIGKALCVNPGNLYACEIQIEDGKVLSCEIVNMMNEYEGV